MHCNTQRLLDIFLSTVPQHLSIQKAIETGFYAISSHPLSFYLMITLDRWNNRPIHNQIFTIYYSVFIFFGLKIITQYFGPSLKARIAPHWLAFLCWLHACSKKQMVSLGDTIRLTMFLVMFSGEAIARKLGKLAPGKFIAGIVLGCSVYIHLSL